MNILCVVIITILAIIIFRLLFLIFFEKKEKRWVIDFFNSDELYFNELPTEVQQIFSQNTYINLENPFINLDKNHIDMIYYEPNTDVASLDAIRRSHVYFLCNGENFQIGLRDKI